MHYSMVKPYYSNLNVITVNFSGAQIRLDFYGSFLLFFFFFFLFLYLFGNDCHKI